MPTGLRQWAFVALALCGADAARADFVGVLQAAPITQATAVAFQDSNVTVGTLGGGGLYNFLDQWKFTLDGSFNVSALAAAINFTDASGTSVLFGITNLQVNLVSDPLVGPPLVSWQTVTVPLTGLQQVVALIPTAPLAAGNYMLEVRGLVTAPGAYSGSLIAQPPAPVPLPDSMPLLAGGLLVLGLSAWRRRPG